MFKRDTTTCSKCDNHSKLNNDIVEKEEEGGLLHTYSTSTEIFITYSYELQKARGKWLRTSVGFVNWIILIACSIIVGGVGLVREGHQPFEDHFK
jgi:hypothetical protein